MSGELVALSSALIWALSSVLMAMGVKRLDVLPMNLVRCVISTIFFWALLPFFGGLAALAQIPSQAWLWLVLSVLGLLVVGDTMYFRSLDLAGVSWAMPVASINPLWSVLMAGFFLGEPLSWSLLVGAVLVIAGIAVLSRHGGKADPARPVDGPTRRKGLLLALATSVAWAVGLISLKLASVEVHSVVVNSIRQPLGAGMLLALTLARGRWRDLRHVDRRSWGIIGLASLLGTGVGSLLFVVAIQMVGAGRTSVLTSASPLLAVPFSMLLLNEQPNRWTFVGIALTTAGIILVA